MLVTGAPGACCPLPSSFTGCRSNTRPTPVESHICEVGNAGARIFSRCFSMSPAARSTGDLASRCPATHTRRLSWPCGHGAVVASAAHFPQAAAEAQRLQAGWCARIQRSAFFQVSGGTDHRSRRARTRRSAAEHSHHIRSRSGGSGACPWRIRATTGRENMGTDECGTLSRHGFHSAQQQRRLTSAVEHPPEGSVPRLGCAPPPVRGLVLVHRQQHSIYCFASPGKFSLREFAMHGENEKLT